MSLSTQTERDFEVLVCDNSPHRQNYGAFLIAASGCRFRYIPTGLEGSLCCYDSSNRGAALAHGDYLCFPSDDDYYCPRFLELLFKHGDNADLIYCNSVDDSCGNECAILNVKPQEGWIDKGGFLIRRDKFTEFKGPMGQDRPADGWMIEDAVRRGLSCKKVEVVGWVHN
jgi:glycosyltransferase involved in cell wall biosynthesis